MKLEYAKDLSISDDKELIAYIVKNYLPKSIPQEGHFETYCYAEPNPVFPYSEEVWEIDKEASYSEDDFRQAADIINKHPLKKRESILQELSKLDSGLSASVQPFVMLQEKSTKEKI